MGFRSILSGAVTSTARPFWLVYDAVSEFISVPFTLFKTKLSLEREIESLKQRVLIAEDRETLARSIQIENIELKKMAGRNDIQRNTFTPVVTPPFAASRKPMLAVVISRPGISLYDTLVVDRGENHGVNSGDVVLSAGGTLLGQIDAVYANSSLVVLMSYPGRKIPVLIGINRLFATATGVGGGVFTLYLPESSNVKVGDSVETVHNEPWVIGEVGRVDMSENEAMKTVRIKSSVNFQQMKWVVIIEDKL
ncbi:MAG: rod shape-determining protein MreC [Candidatus Vogelbacteria bacterium]|nr:rod shape-determining protein MreC [Candidatus Vogelbacteria bacterium]